MTTSHENREFINANEELWAVLSLYRLGSSELSSFVNQQQQKQQLMNKIITSKFVWWVFQVYSSICLGCKRSEE